MKFNYMKSAAMALAFACCVSSCSDFLEEENKTGATAELEYATVSGIDGLIHFIQLMVELFHLQQV